MLTNSKIVLSVQTYKKKNIIEYIKGIHHNTYNF